MKQRRANMIVVDDILIDESIPNAHFLCDLKKCKGACCTFPGEYGAPLLDEEIPEIEKCVEAAKEYLSPKSLHILATEGYIQGKPGKYTTVCINHRDCVFVYYQGNIALCALEKAYIDGKTQFRKPISCHLFPIRVGNYGGKFLYYEKIEECEPAMKNGKAQKVKLSESVKEALIRAYGEEWYSKMLNVFESEK